MDQFSQNLDIIAERQQQQAQQPAFQQGAPVQPLVFRPSFRKAFLAEVFVVLGILVGIAGLVFYMQSFVSLDTFFIVFEQFGIEVDKVQVAIWAGIIVIIIAAIFLTAFAASQRSIRFELSREHLITVQRQMRVMTGSERVPLINVSRVTFDKDSLGAKLFNCGSVTVDISGFHVQKVELSFVDNPELVAKTISYHDAQLNYQRQATQHHKFRIEQITDDMDHETLSPDGPPQPKHHFSM